MNLEYTLEIDANGYIIGGEWNSTKYPDFLWMQTRKTRTNAYSLVDYGMVQDLLNQSRK